MEPHEQFRKFIETRGLNTNPPKADESETDKVDDFEVDAVIDASCSAQEVALDVLVEHNYFTLWNVHYALFYAIIGHYRFMMEECDLTEEILLDFVNELKKDLDSEVEKLIKEIRELNGDDL